MGLLSDLSTYRDTENMQIYTRYLLLIFDPFTAKTAIPNIVGSETWNFMTDGLEVDVENCDIQVYFVLPFSCFFFGLDQVYFYVAPMVKGQTGEKVNVVTRKKERREKYGGFGDI